MAVLDRIRLTDGLASRHEIIRRVVRSLIPRWLYPAFGLPAALFLIGLAVDNEELLQIFKAIPVLALAVAVALARPTSAYRRLVTVALLFGAAGDLILELDYFVYGLVSFLVGQLLYTLAFLRDERRFKPGYAAPFAVWGVALVAMLADGAGDLLVPVAVYAVALCSMMWRAAARSGAVPSLTGIPTAVGAVLFGISDSLIAIDRFGSPVAEARWWIILSYWAAQALIAFGALAREGD